MIDTTPGDWVTGYWIETYHGRRVDPVDPDPSQIAIDDIAHALARQCRFTGHTRDFYCPREDQRVLTADLRWVAAANLVVGDELLGFDEHPVELGSAGTRRRRYRPAVVLATGPIRRRVIRLEMVDGSTISVSAEHPILVATKQSGNQAWRTAEQIVADVAAGRKRYAHKFMEPWTFNREREAGWLAGLYDGEGYIATQDRKGVLCGVSQVPGAVLARASDALTAFGFGFSNMATGSRTCRTLQLRGGWRETARLLGSLRPVRLLDNFQDALHGGTMAKQMNGASDPLEIVATYPEGEDWCAGLETSTHTYLCEGFGSHNSVAQHSVHVSELVAPDLALEALLHDAAEAYLSDLARPVKVQPAIKAVYGVAEERLTRVIYAVFGLPWPPSPAVKVADDAVLRAEARDLMPNSSGWWREGLGPPAALTIDPWPPAKAEYFFRDRFAVLTGERGVR